MKIKFIVILLVALFSTSHAHANNDKLQSITPEQFIAQNRSVERIAIVDFIIKQSDKKTIVTQVEIDKAWTDAADKGSIARFQIVDQKLYIDSNKIDRKGVPGRVRTIASHIEKLLSMYKIKNVDFIMHTGDGAETDLSVPSFIMSKDTNLSNEEDLLLLPDIYMIDKRWAQLIKEIEEGNQKYPWQDKENKIFWRGYFTGGSYNIQNFDKLPRLSLAIFSRLYPDLINAKFSSNSLTESDKSSKGLETVLKILWPEKPKAVKEKDHLKYKYLISLDGNTCAWQRVPWIMLSNSVLVKQETTKMEWFYPAIKPYTHYVPINEKITDLFQQIEWMKTHDPELKQISKNAHNFIKNNLMPEHINIHTVLILNEYHKLHHDQEIIASLTPAEDFIYQTEYEEASITKKIRLWFKKWFKKLMSMF